MKKKVSNILKYSRVRNVSQIKQLCLLSIIKTSFLKHLFRELFKINSFKIFIFQIWYRFIQKID